MTMTKTAGVGARPRTGRKSPVAGGTMRGAGVAPMRGLTTAEIMSAGFGQPREAVPAPQLRRMQISEFTVWLRSRTNKHHRPFQADYLASHGQGRTNTRQQNLRHLSTWLEESSGRAQPWTSELQRYAPAKKRSSTLAHEFIVDLPEVTGGGKARRFEDVRDHAMIGVLTEGVRRTELIQVQTTDLSTDLIAQPFVRVVPLKGGREYTDGRIVPLTGTTARAVMLATGHALAAGQLGASPPWAWPLW